MRLPNENDLTSCGFLLLFQIFFTAVVAPSHAAPTRVHFDQDIYVVSGPGETIQVQVFIDGNPATALDDPVRGGLYSGAFRIDFDGTKAAFSDLTDISVVPELEHFGFNAGAFINHTSQFAGVKGNIDQNTSPLVPYTEPLLATFEITNLASAPDSYPLLLDFFRTVGPNEQMFLDGNGQVLDADLQFGTALVLVIPEPACGVVLLSGFITCWIARRRSQRW